MVGMYSRGEGHTAPRGECDEGWQVPGVRQQTAAIVHSKVSGSGVWPAEQDQPGPIKRRFMTSGYAA